MVNFAGRSGRRRRVLNEEVRSATSAHTAWQSVASGESATSAPRYSDAAGVENHPQITDFVPRRYRTIGMLVASGTATVAVLGALHYFAPIVAEFVGLPTLRPFDLSAPGSLAAWISAVAMIVASAVCLLIYSIRRHRIDDFKGRYRVWLGACVVCLAVSVNSVAGMHNVMALSMKHFTGWSILSNDAVWWLAIAGLPLAWIGLRVMLDVKECRLAAAFLSAAVVCYTASAAGYVGLVPVPGGQNASLVAAAALLLGHWLVFTTIVTYARFVILDAQGLITVREPAVKQEKQDKARSESEAQAAESTPTILSVANYARNKASQSHTANDDDQWVDGRRPERKSYDDYDEQEAESEGGSKLSKSDRKRLRKLKTQNRAA